MSEKLKAIDTDAISQAVDALEDAEFEVLGVHDIDRAGQGVTFTLDVRCLTRQQTLSNNGRDR